MQSRWLKVRLLGSAVPFYESPNEADPVTYLTECPVAEVEYPKALPKLPIVLADGRRGYIPSDSERLDIPFWTVASRTAEVRSEPNLASPVCATLNAGSHIEQYDLTLSNEDQSWVLVRFAAGRYGYITSAVSIIDQGLQVRIRNRPEDSGTRWLLKGGVLRDFTTLEKPPRQAGKRQMILGAGFVILGVAISLSSYAGATASGGEYRIMLGFMVVGAFWFLRGLAQFNRSSR